MLAPEATADLIRVGGRRNHRPASQPPLSRRREHSHRNAIVRLRIANSSARRSPVTSGRLLPRLAVLVCRRSPATEVSAAPPPPGRRLHIWVMSCRLAGRAQRAADSALHPYAELGSPISNGAFADQYVFRTAAHTAQFV